MFWPCRKRTGLGVRKRHDRARFQGGVGVDIDTTSLDESLQFCASQAGSSSAGDPASWSKIMSLTIMAATNAEKDVKSPPSRFSIKE